MTSASGTASTKLPALPGFDAISEIFAALAVEAGLAVMKVYGEAFAYRTKADHSPVCDADEQAEAIILEGLAQKLPGVPVVAEEAASRGEIPKCGNALILVDPLDGTREFLGRNGEFTVNIALVIDGVPHAGAVYAPALGKLWFAGQHAFVCEVAPGAALPSRADWRAIHVRPAPEGALVALASRSHCDAETEAFLARLPIGERRSAGSSLKFCSLAEGGADVYPRFGPTMEWDTAAGDAVLRAAGGAVLACNGLPLLYGKAASHYRNSAFIAWGDTSAAIRQGWI